MGTAVIYCRISRDTAGEHLGVDRQEKLCRALAKKHKLDVTDVLVDNDLSAYAGKRRPAFERLVEMLTSGDAKAVVTYHSDRLYRRAADLERLVDIVEKCKAQVHTVAAGNVDLTTASGRMVARMLGAAAQHESERLGERVRLKHDELAANGKHPGGRPPFGYSTGYVVNPAEAAVVRRMATRVLEGASLLKIARELDTDGIPTREGRPWHHSSVRSTLVNPAVAGLRVHRREVAGPGQWVPVLDRATWEQVRAVLADPARKRSRPARKFLLSGLLENCNGDPVNGATVTERDGDTRAIVAERRIYTTRVVKDRNRPSPALSVGADELEELVVEMVLKALDDATLPEPKVKDSTADEAAIVADLNQLAEMRGNNEISLGEWMAARKPLLARLEAVKVATSVVRPGATAHLLSKRGATRKAWPTLTFEQRREVITTAIERIVLVPAARGKWTAILDRIGEIEWKV